MNYQEVRDLLVTAEGAPDQRRGDLPAHIAAGN